MCVYMFKTLHNPPKALPFTDTKVRETKEEINILRP